MSVNKGYPEIKQLNGIFGMSFNYYPVKTMFAPNPNYS